MRSGKMGLMGYCHVRASFSVFRKWMGQTTIQQRQASIFRSAQWHEYFFGIGLSPDRRCQTYHMLSWCHMELMQEYFQSTCCVDSGL